MMSKYDDGMSDLFVEIIVIIICIALIVSVTNYFFN